MNPAFLDNMSWEMAEVYGAITDQILINIARYFPYFNASDIPKSAFEYQAVMLAQMGQVNRDTIRIIRNNLSGADKALTRCLEQAVIDAVRKAEPELLKGVKAGIIRPGNVPAVLSPNQYRAFNLYYQQAAQKLNLVNTVMLESTKQAYQATVADISNRVQVAQTALDIAAGETVTGVSSWNQALRHSMDRLKANGITGFIDHAGHRWSAESYVAMDIRSTVYNTGRAAVWETNQSFGNDLYIVSYHDGARPLCYPWQNKVISSTNNARTVTDLDGNEIPVYAQSDTSYGMAAGLFGINCKHYPSPFIPGVSVLYDQSNIPSEKENEKIYEQTQQQRALERKLREEKRDLLMAKAQGAPAEEIKALRERCRQTSDDIDTFCDETGLPRRQNREGVFTQREFPAADTYDPKEFVRDQKDAIDAYFSNGGVQHGYSFGQMTPNANNEPPVGFGIQTANVSTEQVSIYNGNEKVFAGKASVYEMPDGTKFVFKQGMNKAHQSLTPQTLIQRYYDIPQELRDKGQKTINVVDRYNPDDAYWRKIYKNFTHSYATGGEAITFYRYDGQHDMDYLVQAIEHEMGHNVDRMNGTGDKWFSELQEWQDAMAKDKAHSGKTSMRAYGDNSLKEDFADSVSYYYTWGKTVFESSFPNRTAIIERLLGIGGASP